MLIRTGPIKKDNKEMCAARWHGHDLQELVAAKGKVERTPYLSYNRSWRHEPTQYDTHAFGEQYWADLEGFGANAEFWVKRGKRTLKRILRESKKKLQVSESCLHQNLQDGVHHGQA